MSETLLEEGQSQRHAGMGMPQSAELALQEAIVLGLHTLALEERAVDELVGRVDAQLQYNTSEDWRQSLRDALLDMLDTQSDEYVQVMGGYPNGVARLPCISLVVQSGGQNEAERVMGNVLRESYHLHGPDTECWATREVGGGESTEVQVGCWSPAPERSWLLAAAVKWTLYQQQERLRKLGIHEVSYRESGSEVSPDLEPRVGYVPMLAVTVNWTFRSSYLFKVPNRVTFTGRFTT